MKFLFALITAAVSVALGWFCYPDVQKSLEARRDAVKKRVEAEVEKAVASKTSKERTEAASGAKALMAEFKGQVPGAPNPSLPSANGGTPGQPVVAVPDAPKDPIEEKYPLPQFKAIEDITKEWSSIPSRAFPRKVKTKVAITFEGPKGKLVMPQQSDLLAVGMTKGFLVIMRSKDEPDRAMVPLANTDLKETMTVLYDKYKAYKTDQVMKQRARAKGLADRPKAETQADTAKAGPKPEVAPGGTIPLMLESIRAKDVTEFTESSITSWGELNVEEIEGEVYWTGTVQCSVENPIFGPTPTEVMALMRNNKVVRWLYSGSREPVQ